MYTKRNYSIWGMIRWTLRDTYKYSIIAIIPVLLYSTLELKWLHLPWLPIALIGTAVAFLVSFKNNASYDRLWEARKIWGGIVNTSRSFSMLIKDYITSNKASTISEAEIQKIKKTLINRHIAWLTAHRYALRQSRPWEFFLAQNSKKKILQVYELRELQIPFNDAIGPYLSKKEFEQIENKGNPATQIIGLQSSHLKKLKDQGLIWEFSFLELEQLLVEMLSFQGKNERIKNFPYPRQFATLNLFIVWIFIVLLPFGIMNEFDKIGIELLRTEKGVDGGLLNNLFSLVAKHFVWFSIPFSIIISWIFHTMERVGEVSENPFEGTANDVPITTMSRDIEIDILEMIGESDIPETIPAVFDIQT